MKAYLVINEKGCFATMMKKPKTESYVDAYNDFWQDNYDMDIQTYEASLKPVVNTETWPDGITRITCHKERKIGKYIGEFWIGSWKPVNNQPCEVEDRGDTYEVTKLY
jgi:hypothetical protein